MKLKAFMRKRDRKQKKTMLIHFLYFNTITTLQCSETSTLMVRNIHRY